ncbi:MAG: DUF4476 domain-containing protein [Flavobacteriales bacterium]
MKKFLLTFTLLGGLLFQAQAISKLSIKLWNNHPMIVILDGKAHNCTNMFVSPSITQGRHAVTILSQTVNLNAGQVQTNIHYDGYLDLPDNSDIMLQLGNDNQITVLQVNDLFPPAPVPTPAPIPTPQPTPAPTPTPAPAPSNSGAAMDAGSFSNFMSAVKTESFDNDKLTLVKTYLNNSWLTSDQVAQMMDAFSFEKNKLEAAKFAWHRVTDPNSYFIVNKKFSFSSSGRDLNKYIQQNPR